MQVLRLCRYITYNSDLKLRLPPHSLSHIAITARGNRKNGHSKKIVSTASQSCIDYPSSSSLKLCP